MYPYFLSLSCTSSLDSDGENGTEFEILLPNEKLEGDKYEYNYEIDIDKIELEFSDIYELYN